MFTSELEYYRQRARAERERAQTAADPIVAEVHRALAERYEGLTKQPESRMALSRLWRSREPPVQGDPRPVAEGAPKQNATPKA
jgi:hypothetical protein